MNFDRSGSNPIITSSVINVSTDPRWNNTDSNLNDQNISIVHFTSSELSIPEYQFYKLAVSGGSINTNQPGFLFHFIHHIDIYQDKNFGEGNRKQITIGFDNTTEEGASNTNFEIAVSSAFASTGFVGVIDPGDFAIINGVVQEGSFLNMNNQDLFHGNFIRCRSLFATSSFVDNITIEDNVEVTITEPAIQ